MFTREKAIVIGGGMAGKLTARVLSDFYNEVLIIEKDSEPLGPYPRKGVPQGEHLHALLFAGADGLEELFPGITEDFHSTGAVKINSTQDLTWFHHGVWKLRFDGGYTTTLQTRPNLEWHIAQYIKKIPNVTTLHNRAVKNFLFDDKKNQILGVELNSSTLIHADLVVDASGTSSFTSTWLEKRGSHVPGESVKIGLTYFSKLFQLPEKKRDWKIKLLYATPPQEKIGGTISLVEGNRYVVTISSYHHAADEKEVLWNDSGFLALSKRLPKQDIYEEIKDAVPVSNTSIYRIPQITWRRFDKVADLPKSLLLIGDTICRIDPVFGQGMSIAVLEALALKKILEGNRQSFEKLFQRQAAKIIAPIWGMVVTEDFRYPETVGKKPLGLSIQQWYAKKIFVLSSENQMVYDSLVQVMNLVSPMTGLMKPRIIGSVVKRLLTK